MFDVTCKLCFKLILVSMAVHRVFHRVQFLYNSRASHSSICRDVHVDYAVLFESFRELILYDC